MNRIYKKRSLKRLKLNFDYRFVFPWIWRAEPKQMKKKTFAVIRNMVVVKCVKADQLLQGDIVVLTPHNPFVPEDCLLIDEVEG